MLRKVTRILILCGIPSLVLSEAATSAVFDQTFSINSQIRPRSNSTYATVDTHTQSVDRFDTSKGTLNSVTLIYDLTFDGGIELDYYNDFSKPGFPKYTDGTIVYQLGFSSSDTVREAVVVSGSSMPSYDFTGMVGYADLSSFGNESSTAPRFFFIYPYIDAHNAPADRLVFFRSVGEELFVSPHFSPRPS